ncbi:glycoside hydrolase [Obba rivulosa]|uniref:Beta-mannosidase B n=1 Tax=Obba rivulosa TaxID=1052685 RepID=A0A8E2AJA6_9APHY|nr:glycoside hydrolase [Obba rivulosa]
MSLRSVALLTGWYWKERDPSILSVVHEVPSTLDDAPSTGWRVAQTFPSEVHVELLRTGLIPDPHLGFNEHKVQWVGEREWLYHTTFVYDPDAQYAHIELLFEGLDTFCDVYLNGNLILETDNMFRTYRIPVGHSALHPSDNILLLHFKPAKLIAKELEEQYGRVRAGSTNLGDPSRVYVRKAQYDWRYGPELMTCGPYRPIHLICYSVRLDDVHARAFVSPAPRLAPSLYVDITVGGSVTAAKRVHIALSSHGGGAMIKDEIFELDGRVGELLQAKAEIKSLVKWDLSGLIDLWWPVRYGEQHMYALDVTLLGEDDAVLDKQSKRIGFRRVALVQEPLQEPDRYGHGTTFLFEVNGVRMFMGGSNWVPADNFLTQVTPERYRAWLTLLRDGNQNMVRLWGGGVFEPDVFYDKCDELGILVWQDFQFACGVYPAHDEFVANVKVEAEDNVRRLRHHPAIALFCGNNEDYQQVLQWGDVTDLPARLLYESVLPEVVERLTDSQIPYHRGSPYGGKGWDTADPTVGDIHQWDVWAGKERPWQEYPFLGGRFVSEFGIPAMPDIRTVDYWLAGNQKDRWAQSKTMAQHNRAGNHERRFAIVMNENFRLTGDLETHIYNTQIMQSEAVSLAYRSWRREWRGKGKEFNSGALIWQLNDCWPVTSWAIIDYFLRPKPAYFTIARQLAPLTVGIFRQFYEFGAFQSVGAKIEVWGTNSTLQAHKIKLELNCTDLISPWSFQFSQEAVLHPNQSTELLSMPCPCPPQRPVDDPAMTTSYSVVVGARLLDLESGEVLARYADWPHPYRHVDFPEPKLDVRIDGERVNVDSDKPVKGLWFSIDEQDGNDVRWSDNALDVMPGDTQVIFARGLRGRAVKVAYMGKEKATLV